MTTSSQLAVIAVVCLLATAILASQSPPPHSLPQGIRVQPLPPGDGGGLWIHAPRQLCTDTGNEFHLHQQVEPNHVRFVAELRADQSSCEWRFDGLAEGEYEALIQVAATGRTRARAVAHVVRGVTGLMTLQPLELRAHGFVTSEGRPRPDLALRFRPHHGALWLPETPVPIGKDGWYVPVVLTERDPIVDVTFPALPVK